jgi:Predicted nucleotide-binding protein containing TIR-like domain
MTRILDQQFVAHLYAPAHGPDAAAAYRALCEIWRGCRLAFQMTEPVEGLGLPQVPPSSPDAVPDGFDGALALQERPFADSQAVLRRHHDVFNLSVALAPPETRRPQDGEWTWWRDFDRTWNAISARYAPHMVGETRLYLAGVDESDPDGEDTGGGRSRDAGRDAGGGGGRGGQAEQLGTLSALMPSGPAEGGDPSPYAPDPRGASLDPAVHLWEPFPRPAHRALRRLVLAVAPGADERASNWVWSSGGAEMPPLARYLLHAAKLRYEMRVWRRDGQGRELNRALDALSSELVRVGADRSALADLLRVRNGQALLLLADLKLLRRTTEIAADNMQRVLSRTPHLIAAHPFVDDAADAQEFLERLDDQIAYLDTRTTRSAGLLPLAPTEPDRPRRHLVPGGGREFEREAAPEQPAESALPSRGNGSKGSNSAAQMSGRGGTGLAGSEADRDTVFVVHGRDERARVATYKLLQAFGLHPVEWDDAVGLLHQPMPFLGRVLREAIPLATAVVAIMTPDDIVQLHPELAGPGEPAFETGPSMQARPNVLIELGMALAYHPHATLILQVGDHRPITDLGGFNYVRVAEGTAFRERIGRRLIYAGCRVHMPEDGDWRTAGDFGPPGGRGPHPSTPGWENPSRASR